MARLIQIILALAISALIIGSAIYVAVCLTTFSSWIGLGILWIILAVAIIVLAEA